MTGGWIGVDLDGTLAHYEHWVSETHIGAPIAPMVARVKAWLDAGKDVRIFTARAFDLEGTPRRAAVAAIEAWCLEHLGAVLRITCRKDFQMVCLYDDRCRQVEENTGRLVGDGPHDAPPSAEPAPAKKPALAWSDQTGLLLTVAQVLLDQIRHMAPAAEGHDCPVGNRIEALKQALAPFQPQAAHVLDQALAIVNGEQGHG